MALSLKEIAAVLNKITTEHVGLSRGHMDAPEPKSFQELYTLSNNVTPSYSEILNKYGSLALVATYSMEPVDAQRCKAVSPAFGLICTREKGHDGQHEAHHEPGVAAIPKWYTESDLKLLVAQKLKYYHSVGNEDAVPASYPEKFYGNFASYIMCGKTHPTTKYSCKLYLGHTGPHQTLYDELIAREKPWTDAEAAAAKRQVKKAQKAQRRSWRRQRAAASKEATAEVPADENEKPWWWPRYNPMRPLVYTGHLETYDPNACGSGIYTHDGGWYVCTRPKDHVGPHEAAAIGKACGPPWIGGEYKEVKKK